jgi:hypothetical protein
VKIILYFFLQSDGKRKGRSRFSWKTLSVALSLAVSTLTLIQKVDDVVPTPVTYAQLEALRYKPIEAWRLKPIEPLQTKDSVKASVTRNNLPKTPPVGGLKAVIK